MVKTYSTLNKWFKNPSLKKEIAFGDKVFYADLLNNKIRWLNREPDNGLIIGSFKWTNHHVNLCLTKESLTLLKKKVRIKRTYPFYNIPVLKSNLQKCVRRCLTNKSVNTAFQLCSVSKNGINELLRRLIVIAVEDSIVTYSIIKIVFLICISSKIDFFGDFNAEYIEISEYVFLFCLKYTKFIAEIKIRDPSYKLYFDDLQKTDITNCELEEKDKVLLMCLLTRAQYGGMKCDVKMMTCITKSWFDRLKGTNKDMWHNTLNMTCDHIKIKSENRFNKKTIVRYSLDFHCTGILNKLKEIYPNYLEEELTKAIWYYNSGVNEKNKIVPLHNPNKKLYLPVWLDIGTQYYKLVKDIQKKMKL